MESSCLFRHDAAVGAVDCDRDRKYSSGGSLDNWLGSEAVWSHHCLRQRWQETNRNLRPSDMVVVISENVYMDKFRRRIVRNVLLARMALLGTL